MSFLLQYQAHVDDLTSLAGSTEDTSWFIQQPQQQPLAAELPPQGVSVGDIHSGAAVVADDQSWLVAYEPVVAPERLSGSPEGYWAGDVDSGPAAVADDQSWFPAIEPTAVPRAPGLPTLGTNVGDFESLAGSPGDMSWLLLLPDTAPLRELAVQEGVFVADVDSGAVVVTDDQSWFPVYPEQATEAEGSPQGWVAGDIDSDATVWVLVGVAEVYTEGNYPVLNQDPFFQAFIRATSGTAKARLFDITAGLPVAGSDVSTLSSTLDRVISGSRLSLVNGNEYQAQFGSNTGSGVAGKGAKMKWIDN